MNLLDDASRRRDLVTARLARPVQDQWEAAVVLEAWVGVESVEAIAAGASAAPMRPIDVATFAAAEPDQHRPGPGHDLMVTALALLTSLWWFGPLNATFGRSPRDAFFVALPAALAAQWALRGRYVLDDGGLGVVRKYPAFAVGALVVVVVVPWLGFGMLGLAVGLVAAIWTTGFLMMRGRGAFLYVGQVAITTWLLVIHPERAFSTLLVSCSVGLTIVVWRAMKDPVSLHMPRPFRHAAVLGVMGASFGVMVIGGSATMQSTPATWAGVGVVSIGVYWAGVAMNDVWVEVPVRMATVPLAHPPIPAACGAWLKRTAYRMMVVTALAALASVVAGRGSVSALVPVVGFGLIASATLASGYAFELVSKVMSGLAVVVGASAALALATVVPSIALVAGAGLATLIVSVQLAVAARDDDVLLATRMLVR